MDHVSVALHVASLQAAWAPSLQDGWVSRAKGKLGAEAMQHHFLCVLSETAVTGPAQLKGEETQSPSLGEVLTKF